MGAAIIAAIPTIVSATPQVVNLISGLVSLIHKHETAAPMVTMTSTSPEGGIVVTPVMPTSAEKKANVLADFEQIALPFIAPALSLALGRNINSAELMPEIEQLVDAITSLNRTLGIFPKAA